MVNLSLNPISYKSSKLVNNIPSNIEGTRFENIQNPYTNLPRQQTFWDRFANWFGFRSGYDKATEQYQMASDEYNAQLSQLASEEKYNSPIEQAARMRQAGLNPDLTGVSGEPASEFDNQQESPDVSTGMDFNPLDLISTIGNSFLSTISGTMSLLMDINSYRQARIATDEKDLDFASKLIDTFQKSDSFMRGQFDSDYPVTSLLSNDSPLFHSKQNIQRFNRFRNRAENSLLGLTTRFKSYEDFAKQSESLGQTFSQPWMNNLGGITPSDIADFLRPLSRAQFDLIRAQVKAESAKAYKDFNKDAFEGDAYGNLNSDPNNAQALSQSIKTGISADTAENISRQAIAPLKTTQARIYGKMINAIDGIPDKNIGTTILKFFLVNQLSSGLGSGLGTAVKAVGKLL